MQEKKTLKKPIHAIMTQLHTILNIGLLSLLLLASFIFFIGLNDYQISVPNFLLKKFTSQLSWYHLSFESSSTSITTDGEIDFQDLKIKYKNFYEPLLSCDHLRLNISLPKLLLGNIRLKELLIRNATIYCPPTLSPTGINEPIIKNLFGAISFKRKNIYLKQLDFDFLNVELIANGQWEIGHTLPALDISSLLQQGASLLKNKSIFESIKKPVATIHIEEKLRSGTHLELRLEAHGLEIEDRLSLGPTQISAHFLYDKKEVNITGPITFLSNQLTWKPDSFIAQIAQGQIALDLKKGSTFMDIIGLKKANLSLHNILFKNNFFDTLLLNTNFDDSKLTNVSAALIEGKNWIAAKCRSFDKIAKNVLNIKGSFKINWAEKLAKDVLSLNFSDIDLAGQMSLDGQLEKLSIKPFNFEKFNAVAQSNQLKYGQIEADHAYTELVLTPISTSLEYGYLRKNSMETHGSYFYNSKTHQYRLIANGSISPDLLNPYFDKWWTKLTNRFHFPTTMPFANLDIQGTIDQPMHTTTFGSISIRDLVYQEVPLKSMNFILYTNKDILDILDLEINSRDGKILANIRDIYDDRIRTHKDALSTTVKGSSSVNIADLNKIIGNKHLHNILKDFQNSITPFISFDGFINRDDNTKNNITALFSTNNPLTYKEFPLDYLKFDLKYTPKKTEISNLDIGFSDGRAQGYADITQESKGKNVLRFNLQLDSADLEKALENIKHFALDKNEKNLTSKFYGGLLNLHVEATGILGEIDSFNGSGNLNISQANLGKFHLFGILSQILSITPLRIITSFDFRNIISSFIIKNNVIHFPDANIFGPTASITAQGNYFIDSHGLDFLMNISPINKYGLPIISHSLLLLSPLTQSFQVQLQGTLENPKWNTTITPFGLFKKRAPGIPQQSTEN